MATDVTVGVDPGAGAVLVNFDDETGKHLQVALDPDGADRAAALFASGGGSFFFTDRVTGKQSQFPVVEPSAEIAGLLRAAASDLRLHQAGKADLRRFMGKVPKA